MFCRATVATPQRLDARSFYFRSELRVCSLLALFLKIFRDRVSCHSLQCGRTISVRAVQFWPLRENSKGILRRRAERQSIGYGDEVGFDYLAEASPGQ